MVVNSTSGKGTLLSRKKNNKKGGSEDKKGCELGTRGGKDLPSR